MKVLLMIALCISLGIAAYFVTFFYNEYIQRLASANKIPGKKIEVREYSGGHLDAWPPDLRKQFLANLKKVEQAKTESEKAEFRKDIFEIQDTVDKQKKDFIAQAALSEIEISDIVNRFARKVVHEPIHDIIAESTSATGTLQREKFIKITGNKDNSFYYPFAYDPSWMYLNSQAYAIYLMRRETPYKFVAPSEPQALGIMTLQGYKIINVDEASDNDVVFYFRHYPRAHLDGGSANDHFVEPVHWGIVRNGGVTSMKDGGVAHHSFNAGAEPGCYYVLFRKDFDPNTPIYDAWRMGDWYDTELGIVRESAAYPHPYKVKSDKDEKLSVAFINGLKVALFFFVLSFVYAGNEYLLIGSQVVFYLRSYSFIVNGLLLFAVAWVIVSAIDRYERRNPGALSIPSKVAGHMLPSKEARTLPPETRNALRKAIQDADNTSLSLAERESAKAEFDSTLLSLRKQFSDHTDVNISDDKTRELVETFSKKIYREPVHDIIDKCGGIHVLGGMNEFIIRTGNKNSDFFYPVRYDSSWMGAFPCYWYALNICRREPVDFEPHSSKAIGMMLAQGYAPVSVDEAADDDVVFYFAYTPDGNVDNEMMISKDDLIQPHHWGVMKNGRVASKQLFGGLASHTLNAGGSPGSRFMIFRKPLLDPNAPVPAMENITDWYETEWCIARKENSYKIYSIARDPERSHGFWLGLALFLVWIARNRPKRISIY